MARSLLQRWLDVYDPIHHGFTPWGIAHGVTARCGFSFPRRAGGHTLYRLESGAAVSAALAVGAVSPTSATPTVIEHFGGYPLAADKDYRWQVRAVSPGGAEEAGGTEWVPVGTDGAGDPIPAAPNAPHRLRGRAVADGYLVVSWEYDPRGQEVQPAVYNVYHDNGGGTVGYVTPVKSTSGRVVKIGPYSHGTAVKVGVRSESRAGNEEANTVIVTVTAENDGPPDLEAPSLVYGGEQ